MPLPGQPASCLLTNLVQAVSVLSQGAAGGSGSDSGTQTAGGDRWGAPMGDPSALAQSLLLAAIVIPVTLQGTCVLGMSLAV